MSFNSNFNSLLLFKPCCSSPKYVFHFESGRSPQQDISQIASQAATETLELFVPLLTSVQHCAARSTTSLVRSQLTQCSAAIIELITSQS